MKSKRSQNNYNVEMVIEAPDGDVRPVTPEDLYIENNGGVREAFRLLYEWQKQKEENIRRK